MKETFFPLIHIFYLMFNTTLFPIQLFCPFAIFYSNFANELLKLNKMLPKFLMADNSQDNPDKIYVVHTQAPRFIVESDVEDFYSNQEIHWIDEAPASEDAIGAIMDEAASFLDHEFESQIDLFDEEENDDE